MSIPTDQRQLRDAVRDKYAAAATVSTRKDTSSTGCCGAEGAIVTEEQRASFGSSLYDSGERDELPESAVLASLGCGNPIAIAELHEGETVLDLGSGGGIDVLLSARRVGPAGLAYGLDMTDEMLDLARRNQAEAGVTNVQWLRGHIEEIPLPRDSVDVIISNCVINLSGDKPQVLREAARVLKPGGRILIVDFAPHELEFLRSELAHRRLGFSDKEVQGWFEAPGLKAVDSIAIAPHDAASHPGAGKLIVKIWVAAAPQAHSRSKVAA